MNRLKELKDYCKEQIIKYPSLKEDITDYFQLALDEIDAGESLPHEISNCINSIEELINE